MILFRQTIDTLPKKEDIPLGKLYDRARKLPENVPANIRSELADLLAEINGRNEERKKLGKPDADELFRKLETKARDGLQKYVREGKIAELKGNARYEKLLSGARSFDEVRAGEILRIRSGGENIASFLLTAEDGDEIDTSKGFSSLIGKKMLVNFGSNRSINASIGLGDILPHDVKKVEITKPNGETVLGTLGTNDSRKGRRERVGYYDQNGKYIAIYGGYSIKVLEVGSSLSAQEEKKYTTLQGSYMESLRIKEMNERRRIVGEKYKGEFQDPEDMKLYPKIEEYAKNEGRRKERTREAYGSALGKERFIQLFGRYVNEVCKTYNMPPELLIKLFEGETKNFDITARNETTGAYGLGQIIPTTWLNIENKILLSDLDENDPKDQILASVALLSDIKDRQNVSWTRAAILYHTGEGLLSLSKSRIDEYLRVNALEIRNNFRGTSSMSDREYAEAYAQAAESYYGFSSIRDTNFRPLEVPPSDLALSGYISHPVEYTSTGVTACSRTAWKNLREFGIIDAPRSGSAKESESLYISKKISHEQILGKTPYNIVDIYLDSSTEMGSLYGHRAVGVRSKSDNVWYVLDPYYGSKTPMTLDQYLSHYKQINGNPNPRFYGYNGTNYLSQSLLA